MDAKMKMTLFDPAGTCCLEELASRSENQKSYDRLVLDGLRRDGNIVHALSAAAAAFPDEDWVLRSSQDLDAVKRHYLQLAQLDDPSA